MLKCRSVVTASIPVAVGRRNNSALNFEVLMDISLRPPNTTGS